MRAVFLVIFVALASLAIGVYLFIYKPGEISRYIRSKITVMTLSSPNFENNRFIPGVYTCDGKNINPSLAISEAPKGAKSLALTVHDPDAPSGNFAHWVMWNIDPSVKIIQQESVPAGAVQGTNSAGRVGYDGPCPPSGTHHYIFKLYALDTVLELDSATTKSVLEQAMAGHILAEDELAGLYGRIR